MRILDDLTEALAHDVFAIEVKSGNPDLADKVANSLGDSSTTMQEAFLGAMRYLRCDRRARALIAAETATATATETATTG